METNTPTDVLIGTPSPADPAQPNVALNADLIAGTAPRKRVSPRITALGAVVIVVVGALGYVGFAPGAPSADAAVYARTFTEGQKTSYRFVLGMKGTMAMSDLGSQPVNMDMSMRLTERVLAVAPDGVATVRQRVKDMTATMDGQRIEVPGGDLVMTLRIAPDGKILSAEGAGGLGFSQAGPATEMLGPDSMGPLLPPSAIAPGDTWRVSHSEPLPFGDGSVTMTADNTLVALRQVDGRDAAVIRSVMRMPMDFRVSAAEMLAAAGDVMPEGFPGMPKQLEFIYDGAMVLNLTQTVDRVTSAPISVLGDGTMDLKMTMRGIPGVGAQTATMDVDLTMSMREL